MTLVLSLNSAFAQGAEPSKQDIFFAHDYFYGYTEFYENFHTFFNKNNPQDYSTLSINDWNNQYEQFERIYKQLKELKPSSQFEESFTEFMQAYNTLLTNWEHFIDDQEENTEDYSLSSFMLDVATTRIALSSSYANIYNIYNAWPQNIKDEVNTKDLLDRWYRMEELKGQIINRRMGK